jgi:hypothetical protein
MAYLIFYQISTEKILSYVFYNFQYEGEELINPPSKQLCVERNNISINDIGVKKWTKENPLESDFKNNLSELSGGDLEDI